MKIKITKGPPSWSKVQHDKDCLFVEFPNCISSITGTSFKWMPSYRQIEEIRLALKGIETEWEDKNCHPCACPHCGLSIDEHDGSGFCPGGTEEFGGKR